ncbi:ester cyclase [Actinokineospora inagensis]|uniref:ester cyclase n=1 Tax=Actinokineospora inagensis TaxID=103730 RepID=UPI00047E3778|nr:ester cyclase [Actinokineospora inagensis]
MENTTQHLVNEWLAIWNGEYSPAQRVISADFSVHAAMLDGGDGSALHGPDALVEWVAQLRAVCTDLVFTIEVGPITADRHVALRWVATGAYAGGFPGATAAAGTPIHFTGTDILRVEDGQFAEYWLNSDVHVLLAQLGFLAPQP